MLRRKQGATIAQIVEATGWQPHTVRGAFAGALKKKLGLTVTSEKVEGEERVYRLACLRENGPLGRRPRGRAVRARTPAGRVPAADGMRLTARRAGLMFWFTRNRLAGSYCFFTAASRA